MASVNADKPQMIFMWGPPGSGKGTCCKAVHDMYGFIHISVGELLRQHATKPGSVELAKLLDNGDVTPFELTLKIIDQEINQKIHEAATAGNQKPIFIIDGYPRDKQNFQQILKHFELKWSVPFALKLLCNRRTCKIRLLGRGRSDDNDAKISKRLDLYNSETLAAITEYKKTNVVHEIDTNDIKVVVFAKIVKIIHDWIAALNIDQ